MAFAEPPWATAVGPQTAVGHGGRRGPRRLVAKLKIFETVVSFCKMIKKYKKIICWPELQHLIFGLKIKR
jgi:hypothetical protein